MNENRNLFGIDFAKDKTTTKKEFEAAWRKLREDKKEVGCFQPCISTTHTKYTGTISYSATGRWRGPPEPQRRRRTKK